MLNTNMAVKTGSNLVSFLYNVPEAHQPYKVDGNAVSKIEIEVSVDGVMFYKEEFRFHGGNPTRCFGNIAIPNLGDGLYTYKVTETMVHFTKGVFGYETIGKNVMIGTFELGAPVVNRASIPKQVSSEAVEVY